MVSLDSSPVAAPSRGHRTVLERGGVRVRTTDCTLGVDRGTLSGLHRRTRIGLVLWGRMRYQGAHRPVLLTPGAMLMGGAGDAYQKTHVDDGGDRCLLFEYGDSFFEGATVVGDATPSDLLSIRSHAPASVQSLSAIAAAERALHGGDVDALYECAHLIVEAALRGDVEPHARAPTRLQERRMLRVVAYIEACYAEDCSLERLADMAGLSRYHTVRLFRQLTQQTPLQFILATRLRAAASLLHESHRKITEVALDVGFSDLSNFNASFVRCFAMTPTRYRALARRPAAA